MLFGEKMPDKNDPKYKDRYEREVSARNSRPTRTATEMQDSVLRERHKRLQGGEIRENRNENKKNEPQ